MIYIINLIKFNFDIYIGFKKKLRILRIKVCFWVLFVFSKNVTRKGCCQCFQQSTCTGVVRLYGRNAPGLLGRFFYGKITDVTI